MTPRAVLPVFRRLSPFHPRLAALSRLEDWYSWAGCRAPRALRDEELEYFCLRSTAGLFDLSPMTKYRIEGPEAEAMLERLTVRSVARLAPGRAHYTAWCDGDGQVLDDGTLFRLGPGRFLLTCQERHLPWLLDTAAGFDVQVTDATEALAALALQGPTSAAILRRLGVAEVETLAPFALAGTRVAGVPVTLARTGFSGDLGYELFAEAGDALALWDGLAAAGEGLGLGAVGWTALDRARIEAGFLVAGVDYVPAGLALRADRARLPDEIGLGRLVDEGKGPFSGRAAILAARRGRRLRHRLVGLEIEGQEPATGAIVYHRGRREAGIVTSAVWSPTLKRNVAIATLDAPFGFDITTDFEVEIYALHELRYAKLMKPARIVPRPFLRLPRRTVLPPGNA